MPAEPLSRSWVGAPGPWQVPPLVYTKGSRWWLVQTSGTENSALALWMPLCSTFISKETGAMADPESSVSYSLTIEAHRGSRDTDFNTVIFRRHNRLQGNVPFSQRVRVEVGL